VNSAFVGLIGRPSTGKSSLLNLVCGHKVSIVSPSPQTTRNKVRGIFTDERGQLVFIDTPGFHNSDRKFNSYLRDLTLSTLKDVDLILYLIDVSRAPGEEERVLISLVKDLRHKLVIGLNKIDISPNHLAPIKDLVNLEFTDVPVMELSCRRGAGVTNMVTLLLDRAPAAAPFYPQDHYTDQTPEFRISEIIREKVILNTRQEVPHAVYIEIADMEMREEKNLLWVRGFICVERDSQKGILVGKQGNVIKKITKEALEDLNSLFPYRIYLDLRVKVHPRWKGDDRLLKKLLF
jgi:GTP-binding protein Era